MASGLALGIDVGSVSAKIALTRNDDTIVWQSYKRLHGRPVECCMAELDRMLREIDGGEIVCAAATGSGGKLIAQLMGIAYVNEVIAQARATDIVCPDAKSVSRSAEKIRNSSSSTAGTADARW